MQDGRPLDQGDGEKQQDENAERDRDGNRALPAAAPLRLGEDDSFLVALLFPVLVHVRCMRPLPDQRCNGAEGNLGEEDGKQRKQVKDGEGKQTPRGARGHDALAVAIDLDRKPQHAGAKYR